MTGFIRVSNGSIHVDIQPNPNYKNEVIIGGQRFTLPSGVKYKDLQDYPEVIISNRGVILKQKEQYYELS